ncbi:MAG: hypothetical protein AAFQ94_12565 [Bacteroidota bacterium]
MILNIKRNFYYSTLVFLSLIFLASCGQKTEKKGGIETTELSEAEQKIIEEIDKVIHDMPPPTEVPFLLKETGADFNPKLINSLAQVDAYTTTRDKAALNAGVYATDIGYLSSYEQVENALDYLEACQKLAESIGAGSVFNVELMSKFEQNLDNPDSLMGIVNTVMLDAEQNLENSDKLTSVALTLVGSYIEGMYLATQVIDTYPDDLLPGDAKNIVLQNLMKVILEQEQPLLDVIALMKDLEEDETIDLMIEELNILRILYQDDLRRISEKIEENDGTFQVTPDMLKDIIIEVKRIRDNITE